MIRSGILFSRTVLGVLAAVAGLSCTLPPPATPQPRGKLLKEEELGVCITRVGQYPRHVVVSAEKVPVRVYLDPGLADPRQVKAYTLWRTSSDGRAWEKVATALPEELPISLPLAEEGLIGLRGSILYADDEEMFAPSRADEPALWLRVDRTPPGITWIEPPAGAPIRGLRSVRLTWLADEAFFGDKPLILEWSPDRGRTWRPIAAVKAERGRQSYSWRIPPELASDVIVRAMATDLTGREAWSELALSYPIPGDAHSAAVASADPVRPPRAAAPQDPRAPVPGAATAPLPAAAADETAVPVTAAAREPAALPGVSSGPAVAPAEAPGALPSGAVLALEPLAPDLVRGGAEVAIAWRCDAEAVGGVAAIEWSADGGATWTGAGAVPLAAGRAACTAPAASGRAYALRLRAALPDGGLLEAVSPNRIAVDADPPAVRLGKVPEVLGARSAVPLEVSDPGSGIASIEAFLRAPGAAGWRRLAAVEADAARGTIEMDLSGEAEGVHELFVRAGDRAGNATAPPPEEQAVAGAVSPAFTRFRLDRTAPRLAVRPAPLPWVAGFRADVEVDIDWTDAVPPLVIEEGRPDGSWLEAGRWTSVSPGQERFSFDVPPLVREHAVRFTVVDAAGNSARAVIGPRPVEPPLRLVSFTDGKTYPGRGAEKIRWTLHPIAAEIEGSLRASVTHLRGRGGQWEELYANLPAAGECYWDMPEGDEEEHRIRVRLRREPGGEIAGEDVSPPFRIGVSGAVAPAAIRISEESLFYSEQARSRVAEHAVAMADGRAAGSTELEKLGAEIRAAFEKAIELDARNYHATYGLAQFLNRADPAGNAAAVSRWLRRTVEIKPDHLWALNDLAALSIRGGNFAEAEVVLRRCAAIDPSPIVLYNLGLALFHGGRPVDARKCFEDALRAGGRGTVPEGEAYYYISRSYFQEGERDRAIALFREKEREMPPELRQDLARLFAL